MRILLLVALFLGLSFGLRMSESVQSAESALAKAGSYGSKKKTPYLYSRAHAYKNIAYILASNMDSTGAEIFAIRAVNTVSKAISYSLTGEEELLKLREPVFDKEKRRRILRKSEIKDLKEKIQFLRENKGIKCSPEELGTAEAYYEATVYAFASEEIPRSIAIEFYTTALERIKVAEEKLKMAMENELECYTGKKVQIVLREEKEEEPRVTEEPLKIVARIHFDFDKYEIKEEYIPILMEVVRTLKENPFFKVRIEGYTDIVGSKEYNEKLALKRAKAVRDFLIKQGIPENKIEIVGYGKERFIAENETPIGRLTNRRVEFIVIKVQER